jgi:hypothetical protein
MVVCNKVGVVVGVVVYGYSVETAIGMVVGNKVGVLVGVVDGTAVGTSDGAFVGGEVGAFVGVLDGSRVICYPYHLYVALRGLGGLSTKRFRLLASSTLRVTFRGRG